MARHRQSIAISQIEKILGYKTNYYLNNNSVVIGDTATTFYTDLTPVSESPFDHAGREVEEYSKQEQGISGLDCSSVKAISKQRDTVVLERTSHTDSLLHIHHPASGFHLPLRLARNEASKVLTVAKFAENGSFDAASIFFQLPREIRNKIYEFAIPDRDWKANKVTAFNALNFAGAIGHATGFYFPLGDELSILRVSKQMREEALPIAYRRTFFRLHDMDDFVRVALSVGDIGRANIESVEFAWESRGDSQLHQPDKHPLSFNTTADLDKVDMRLTPSLHVDRCAQLLKECTRLKLVRLYFEDDFIRDICFAVDIRIPRAIISASTFSAPDMKAIISKAVLKVSQHKPLNTNCYHYRNYLIPPTHMTKEEASGPNGPEVQIECTLCCN